MNNQANLFFRKHTKRQCSDDIPSSRGSLFHRNSKITTKQNAHYHELNLNTNYRELKPPSVIEIEYQKTAI